MIDGQGTFDRHWAAHRSDVSPAKLDEANEFLKPVRELLREGRPIRILDVGCGDGVHATALVRGGLDGHRYLGVDLSLSALRTARDRTSPSRTTFQAGDALQLPYRAASFDAVFSYGVLAYTTNPAAGLAEIARVCKPGGLVGVWVSPKQSGVAATLLSFVRQVCRRGGPLVAAAVVALVIPLLPLLPVRSGVNLFNSSWAQCAEVVEVNLLPRTLEFFSREEVDAWFTRCGLHIQFHDSDRPIAVWARV